MVDYGIKKFWRCHVCNDIHYGTKPPAICPTCGAKNAFALSDRNEGMLCQGEKGGGQMFTQGDQLVKIWEDFAAKNDFKLWDDKESVKLLAQGEIENQKNKGLKYCPCRATSGDLDKDLLLICPCNFEIQKTWKDYGECWCGLFVKR
jgi:ferredoxin-thioredoxin reductase catalytic chain